MFKKYIKVNNTYIREIPLSTDILISTLDLNSYIIETYYRITNSLTIEIPQIVFRNITGNSTINYETTYTIARIISEVTKKDYYIHNCSFPLLFTRILTGAKLDYVWRWYIWYCKEYQLDPIRVLLYKTFKINIVGEIAYEGFRRNRACVRVDNKLLVPMDSIEVDKVDWVIINKFNDFLKDINLPNKLTIMEKDFFFEEYPHLSYLEQLLF